MLCNWSIEAVKGVGMGKPGGFRSLNQGKFDDVIKGKLHIFQPTGSILLLFASQLTDPFIENLEEAPTCSPMSAWTGLPLVCIMECVFALPAK